MREEMTQFPKVVRMMILHYFVLIDLYAQVGKALGRVHENGISSLHLATVELHDL